MSQTISAGIGLTKYSNTMTDELIDLTTMLLGRRSSISFLGGRPSTAIQGTPRGVYVDHVAAQVLNRLASAEGHDVSEHIGGTSS